MEHHQPLRSRKALPTHRSLGLVCGLIAALAFSPAWAQQGQPAHSIPIAPGIGSSGWKPGGPCPTGQSLIWQSGAAADPTCGLPGTGAIVIGTTTFTNNTSNGIVYGDTGAIARQIAPVNNGIVLFGGTGIPAASTTLPSVVQLNITNLGTVTVGTFSANIASATLTGGLTATGQTITGGTFSGGTWSGNTVAATVGGTGLASPTAHSLVQTEGASAFGLLTAATAGRVPIDQGAGVDWAATAISGDATLAASGTLTVTKTNGTAFGPLATQTVPCLISQGCTGQTTALGARSSAGLNIDQLAKPGNVNYTILSTDRTVSHTLMTHPLVDTLPAANSVNQGQEIVIVDQYGQATATNTLTVAAAGADTINGLGSAVIIAASYGGVRLVSDGVSAWSYVSSAGGGGGGGTVTQVNCAKGAVCSSITTTGIVNAPAALIAAAGLGGAL